MERRSDKSERATASVGIRSLIRLSGKAGLRPAVRLDLLRELGLRYARQRMQADALLAPSVEGSTRRVYQKIWQDAAAALGAEIEQLPHGFTKIVADGRSTSFWQRMVMLDDAMTLKLAAVSPELSSYAVPSPMNNFRLRAISSRPSSLHGRITSAAAPVLLQPFEPAHSFAPTHPARPPY